MPHATITGIGAYLPDRILTNRDLESMVDTSDEWILTRTGISERRIVDDAESTSDLAARAGTDAIRDAGLIGDDIDLLIVATSSPDMVFPSTATLAQAKMGLSCPAYDVMAACTGYVYALHDAVAAVESGRYRRVLVVGADAFSRLVDFTDRATCVLFGDGAGATVVEASDTPGILGIDLGSDGQGADMLMVPGGGAAAPLTAEDLEQGRQYVSMRGNEVFKFAVRIIPQTVSAALEASGLGIGDIDWIVPHQANQRILDTIAQRLDVPRERVATIISQTGNTSAASIPLALHHLYTSDELSPDDIAVLVGFGAGVTWGSAVVRWTKEAR